MPKYKVGEDGKLVMQEGKLILVQDDGAETPFDALGVYATFGTIRSERDSALARAKAAEEAVRPFGETADERAKAMERIRLAKNFDDKKLVDANKVDDLVKERLQEATQAWNQEKQILVAQAQEASGKVRKHLILSRFATSKALEKTVLTPDLAEAKFGSLFDVEGDNVIGYRDSEKREKIYSRADPSKLADFDEALSILLSSDPNYPKWKAGSGASGGSGPGNSNASNGNSKAIPRAEFDAMPPEAKMAHFRAGGDVVEG